MTFSRAPTRLYGILGRPLGHSLSPALHSWAFARQGYAGAYLAWEKREDELPGFFAAVRSLPVAGLSVTLPYKEAVTAFLDGLTPRAIAVGAVNTVFWDEGRLLGDNTDVAGFLAPLRGACGAPPAGGLDLPVPQGIAAEKKAPAGATGEVVILGAGGVCRAALAALHELGFAKISVAARSPAKAGILQQVFGCGFIPWEEREEALLGRCPELLINATPLGMLGALEGQSPLPASFWPRLAARRKEAGSRCLVYEIIYRPAETLFLNHARAAGFAVLDGAEFFAAQAVEQFRIWTGLPLPFDAACGRVRELLGGV